MPDEDDDSCGTPGELLKRGAIGIVKVAATTALLGPVAGGAVLMYEVAKDTAYTLGGDEAAAPVETCTEILDVASEFGGKR